MDIRTEKQMLANAERLLYKAIMLLETTYSTDVSIDRGYRDNARVGIELTTTSPTSKPLSNKKGDKVGRKSRGKTYKKYGLIYTSKYSNQQATITFYTIKEFMTWLKGGE